MKTKLFTLFFILLISVFSFSQSTETIKGLCIASPSKSDVGKFVELIDKQLAPSGLNVLVLRIDFDYEYKKRPELRSSNPLSEQDVKSLVDVCKAHNIKLIPQVNLLGHQSWASSLGKLLEVYPEFDETPSIQLPAEYKWPNEDGLYCKSYCPKHPDVHAVVFDLVDEIVEVFESDAFHAGLDEVFYIAHDDCERCKGDDPSLLFADEVTNLRNHLAQTNCELWMWGDRLIDGKVTGLGIWEGSYNNTHRAIDLIPKDVVINDWHYDVAHATPFMFAAKGFDVIACPWNKPEVAINQVEMMDMLRNNSTSEMKSRYRGIMHTYWGSASSFMAGMNGDEKLKEDGAIIAFKELSKVW